MEPLVVVTGHPRTGTSMMMRMLHLGGMTVVADADKAGETKGKKGNKYGSYEVLDFRWFVANPRQAAGTAVKIVTQYINVLEALIEETPLTFKAIFMQRSLDAIQRSLKELDHVWDPPPHESIALGRKVLEHYSIPTLYVKYADALEYPWATCLSVQQFIGKDLDLQKMMEAIDPAENHQGA